MARDLAVVQQTMRQGTDRLLTGIVIGVALTVVVMAIVLWLA